LTVVCEPFTNDTRVESEGRLRIVVVVTAVVTAVVAAVVATVVATGAVASVVTTVVATGAVASVVTTVVATVVVTGAVASVVTTIGAGIGVVVPTIVVVVVPTVLFSTSSVVSTIVTAEVSSMEFRSIICSRRWSGCRALGARCVIPLGTLFGDGRERSLETACIECLHGWLSSDCHGLKNGDSTALRIWLLLRPRRKSMGRKSKGKKRDTGKSRKHFDTRTKEWI